MARVPHSSKVWLEEAAGLTALAQPLVQQVPFGLDGFGKDGPHPVEVLLALAAAFEPGHLFGRNLSGVYVPPKLNSRLGNLPLPRGRPLFDLPPALNLDRVIGRLRLEPAQGLGVGPLALLVGL